MSLPARDAVLSVAEARALDHDARERLGMPTLLLMENAARGVADVARELGDRYRILCGPGNNGGDGLAAARHLGRAATTVHLLAEPDPHRAPDAARNLRILRQAGWSIEPGLDEAALAADAIATAQGARIVWIDALFGIGLERPLVGAARRWVELCNRAPARRLAVDVPSGLHADQGVALGGVAVIADATVTFEKPKLGLVQAAAAPYVGRIVVVPLGLP